MLYEGLLYTPIVTVYD